MDRRAVAKRVRSGLAVTAAVGVVLALGVGMASAARTRTVRVRETLAATTKAPKAHGKLVLVVRSGKTQLDGALDIGARHLASKSTFDVLIDGVKVAALSTNGGGNGKVKLRTKPHGHALVLGVDARGKQIVLRDGDGDDVLEGDCPHDKPNAGTVACCVPGSADGAFDDDHHGEGGHGDHGHGEHRHGHGHGHDGDDDCRRLTVDECAAVGGSSAGGSCLPDPCTATAPAGSVCCVPEDGDEDGEGAECRLLGADQCASKGGTMISAAGCDPNPCSPTPPAEPRIACCTQDDGDDECRYRTAAECDAHQGVNEGAVSCRSNPCGDSQDGNDDDQGQDGDD